MYRPAILALSLALPVFGMENVPCTAASEVVRHAVEKGLFFIEHRSMLWWKKRECATCHEGQILVFAANVAKAQGVPVDQVKLDFWTDRWLLTDALALNAKTGRPNGLGTPNAALLLLHRDKDQDAAATRAEKWAALLNVVFEQQQDDGNWDKNPKDVAQVTPRMALALADLESSKMPLAPALRREIGERRERTETWIQSHDIQLPDKTESLAGWVVYEHQRGDKSRAARLLAELLGRRREDGGWGITKTDPSHLLVTAVVLQALKTSGLANDNPVVSSTQTYLLGRQAEDGRWRELGRHFHPDSHHSAYDVWTTGHVAAALSLTVPKTNTNVTPAFHPDPQLAAEVVELTRSAAEGYTGRSDRTGDPMQADEKPVQKDGRGLDR